jgi:hypothetical protein
LKGNAIVGSNQGAAPVDFESTDLFARGPLNA